MKPLSKHSFYLTCLDVAEVQSQYATLHTRFRLLPTAYVVRREGYVLTRVCPSVCPHPGGYPGQVQPAEGYPTLGTPHRTWPGGGFTPTGGTLTGGTPPQQYLIRRGRYASCIHAGGLSCSAFLPTRQIPVNVSTHVYWPNRQIFHNLFPEIKHTKEWNILNCSLLNFHKVFWSFYSFICGSVYHTALLNYTKVRAIFWVVTHNWNQNKYFCTYFTQIW